MSKCGKCVCVCVCARARAREESESDMYDSRANKQTMHRNKTKHERTSSSLYLYGSALYLIAMSSLSASGMHSRVHTRSRRSWGDNEMAYKTINDKDPSDRAGSAL